MTQIVNILGTVGPCSFGAILHHLGGELRRVDLERELNGLVATGRVDTSELVQRPTGARPVQIRLFYLTGR